MFDFLKNLFSSESTTEKCEEAVTKTKEMILKYVEEGDVKEQEVVVEDHNPLEGISEPVISFVKCVKNNPKRFGLRTEYSFSVYCPTEITYTLTDRFIGEVFTLTTTRTYDGSLKFSHKFMTDKECFYVHKELENYFRGRVKRITGLKKDKERKRLMSIYCEEGV